MADRLMAAARKPKPPTGGTKKATSRAASVSDSSRRRMRAAFNEGLYQASGKKRSIRTRDNGSSPIYGLDAEKKKTVVRPPQATEKQWLKHERAKRASSTAKKASPAAKKAGRK